MKARFFLIALAFVALCAFAAARDAATPRAVSAQQPAAAAEVAAAPRQTGYCQVNGCIDMPSSGYCPSGYYRFQGTWCCCPIRRQPQPAGPTAVLAAAGQAAAADYPVSFLDASMGYGRGVCGQS
jgi:hypothetical protein